MLLQLNPMVGLMTSYQGIMVNHQWPQWHHLLPITIAAVIFCLIAWRLFRKNVGEMMDEL
jgi:lipopolysaccharide transport system permease protein